MCDLSPLPLTGRREGEDPEPSCPSRDGLVQQWDPAASWPVKPCSPDAESPGPWVARTQEGTQTSPTLLRVSLF